MYIVRYQTQQVIISICEYGSYCVFLLFCNYECRQRSTSICIAYRSLHNLAQMSQCIVLGTTRNYSIIRHPLYILTIASG